MLTLQYPFVGVAGAGIISTNLASREGTLTEVFNPTVPGKSVYALFAFAAINGYDHALKCLGGDVVILINDVAAGESLLLLCPVFLLLHSF